MLLVTHDMAVVAETCDSIAVMYAGVVVETGPTHAVLDRPHHPYTMGLRNAFPSMEGPVSALISIPGTLPDLIDPPAGCRFASRCPFATELCVERPPDLVEVAPGQRAACHYADRASEMREEAATAAPWESVARRGEAEEKAI
jgi:peptide/nickel transport system ATP-binding protein